LCGSTVEDTGFDKTTNEQAKQVLMSSAQRILPLLAAYQPIKQWAGLRPASPNGIPFIGKHPVLANLWINAGQFRNGLVLAPASAQLLLEQMLDLQLTINPTPYQVL
jgi:glycine oxidase